MRAVDTNVLVRLITGDDEKQAAVAEAFVSRGVWISHLVLAETAWVLRRSYNLDDARITSAIEMLLNQEAVSLQDAAVVSAALDHFRRRPSLGFSDCLVLEIARKAGHMPLGTFDKNLSKLDGVQRL
jgi:Predicted nucleic-acid-binding protein, contains PIN domain